MDFNLSDVDLNTIIVAAIKVAVIVAIVLVLILAMKRMVPKLVKARIPRIREESSEQLAHRSDTVSRLIIQVASAILWLIAIVMILSVVGFDVAPLIAGIGVVGLAIGFAAQNIIRDYLNGLFIVMEDWYRVGEFVTVSGVGGIVEQMTLRRTVFREVNGTMHVMPNSQIPVASNWTRDWARIDLSVSVAYRENLEKVFAVINEVCQGLKDDPAWGNELLTTPSAVRVGNLGDNGIDIVIRGDTKPMQQWALTGELRKRIKNRFDEEGIEIPWPHTKVYFGNAPGDKDS